jgi:hypothetical protein
MTGITGTAVDASPALKRPLRREAGERKGPIAKQWVGEVVCAPKTVGGYEVETPTSPSPRDARVPSLSPHFVGGEGHLTSVDRSNHPCLCWPLS